MPMDTTNYYPYDKRPLFRLLDVTYNSSDWDEENFDLYLQPPHLPLKRRPYPPLSGPMMTAIPTDGSSGNSPISAIM